MTRKTNLAKKNLSHANLSGSNLAEADLRETDLSDATLKSTDLTGANASNADLTRNNLSGARLHAAQLSAANLSEADLRGADLSGANLHGARLSGAKLRGADLSEADLTEANLEGTNVAEASAVAGARLTRVSGLDADQRAAAAERRAVIEEETVPTLVEERCVACRKGAPTVTEAEVAELEPQIPEWELIEVEGIPRLRRTFRFPDFAQALAFTNRVGQLAEEEGHHPAILTEWGKVTVTWWTHKIRGLHRNDFVMAAKTDQLAAGTPGVK